MTSELNILVLFREVVDIQIVDPRSKAKCKGTLKNIYNEVNTLAQSVKNLPAVQETWVQSLGWEDTLEKEMATHYSILAWKISRTQEPGGLQSMGLQRVGHDWATNTYLNTLTEFKIGAKNRNNQCYMISRVVLSVLFHHNRKIWEVYELLLWLRW